MQKDITRRKAILESETIALFSKWVEESQIRVRVRKIGVGEKIIVDTFEFSPSPIELPRHKVNRIAVNAAIAQGVLNADYTLIHLYSTERKVMRADGSMAITNITEKSYVFSGVI